MRRDTFATALLNLVGTNALGGPVNGPIERWQFVDSSNLPTQSEIQTEINRLTAVEPLRQLRIKRNQKLAQSDWMAVSDRVMTQAQIDYRQALRDLPETANPQLDENGNLANVTWPTPPND